MTFKQLAKQGAVLLFTGLFVAGSLQPLAAQVSEYERLAFQNKQPNVYVDVFSLPGETEDEVKLATIFQLSYNFLPFKKLKQASPKNEGFMSAAELNIEVFKSPKKGLKADKQIKVSGLQSVGRDTWKDTAYAADYKQTQSRKKGLAGSMQLDLKPGYYTYLLQLNREDQTKKRNSRTRNIRVSPYSSEKPNGIILGRDVDNMQNPGRLTLINMGNNVTYGEDFYAFIQLPEFDEEKTYSIQVDRVDVAEKDTTQIKRLVEREISADELHQNVRPRLENGSGGVALSLEKQTKGYTYALLKIANSQFPNAVYRMNVTAESASRPVASGIFRSNWDDIPTGLLSLDVAIDLLKFITDKETIKKIDDGSDRDRERKFREFWESKDPTPKTEFNELQAEYYRRIDHSYENFGSQNMLGFNGDRGEVYINYGPPNDVDRTFPTNGATTEVWSYPSRKFVFKATSGFGDFQLVSR
jgi:GWxTD domain-containing protein